MIQGYLKKQQHAAFVDVFNVMLNANGKPRSELFRKDSLHMNPAVMLSGKKYYNHIC